MVILSILGRYYAVIQLLLTLSTISLPSVASDQRSIRGSSRHHAANGDNERLFRNLQTTPTYSPTRVPTYLPTTRTPTSKPSAFPTTSSPTLMPFSGPRNSTGGSIKVGWTSGPTLESFNMSSGDSGDAFLVTGSTGDIYNTADRFHYLYFNHTGIDVAVTCFIKSFVGTHRWRKGGIMLRKNLDPRSVNSMIAITGTGFTHQVRSMEGKSTVVSNDMNYPTSNVWLRLVKSGNSITSYIKRDGEVAFMRYQTVEVDLGPDYYVGIAVTNNDPANRATLDVEKFEIDDNTRGDGVMMDMIGTSDIVRVVEVKREDVPWAKVPPGMWSINATGAGIGGTADNFGFVQQEMTGNVTTTLHLERVFRRNKHTRAGLMIRASLAVDAAHVSLLIDVDRGVTMVSRTTNGGPTESKCVGVWTEDIDLTLVKMGNTVQCLYKQHGTVEWIKIGSVTADFGINFFVGQAMASGESGQIAQLMTGPLVVDPSLTSGNLFAAQSM